MDTRTDEQRAYLEALLNRLRRLYVERVQLPGDGKTLSFELLQRPLLLCHQRGLRRVIETRRRR